MATTDRATLTLEGFIAEYVTPGAVYIPIPESALLRMKQLAAARFKKNGYAVGSKWENGFHSKGVLKGMAGEYAVKTYCEANGLPVQWNPELLPGGDDGSDVTVSGNRIQVKTGALLILRYNEKGKIVLLTAPIYAFCEWFELHAWFTGWTLRKTILGCPIELTNQHGCNHRNFRVSKRILFSPESLIAYMKYPGISPGCEAPF